MNTLVVNIKQVLLGLFFLVATQVQAQVSFDQVVVKIDSAGNDSVQVRYTSYLGKAFTHRYVIFYNHNYGCVFHQGYMEFKGSLTTSPITYDTTLLIGYRGPDTVVTKYLSLKASWDTASVSFPPFPKIIMDTYIYDSCQVTRIDKHKQKLTIDIWPNPAKTTVNFRTQNNNPIESIKIYDLNGKLIAIHSNPSSQIQVSELPNGIYFVEIKTNQDRKTKKLIINR
ncbi:MAG: T9SS C-terminal target domain-containing protein [Bacteroidetes bacterium]|nr:MAG: T9SS C-terminal target domain-containing protein [Bacteroidota bacterium]MBL1145031.1 T9SS C-terminal target domain-containing protein [Bacteroidota bacterium]NOG57828.1 T9SS type A sorting domain-containing protein [Bacteroidota bacterium]